MTRRANRLAGWFAPPLVLFLVLVAVWQASVIAFSLPAYLVPGPGRVLNAAWGHRTDLVMATMVTGGAALGGFFLSLLAGFVIAFAFSQSSVIRRSCYPYAIFLQTVPIVAIAPLIINWFGSGFQSVVLVSCIISLFPIITNGTEGLSSVDPRLLELFDLYNATRWDVLKKLRLPNSVPYLITGAKTSCGLSVIGAIVGELFAGYGTTRFGLGYIISQTSGNLKTDYLFATVLACTLLGLAIFGTVSALGQSILRQRHQSP